jgi:hypothetical protein
MNHQRQLPGEIEGVLHAGVHALAAGRAVDMGGISSEVAVPQGFLAERNRSERWIATGLPPDPFSRR